MKTVMFGDVVHRANTKEDRFNTDKIYYVGGEHIDTGELLITKRGIIKGSTIGPMFYCGFKKGQILLASRSPDLKKSGMVTFDGICSEKTFVIEPIDDTVLTADYLTFIVSSERFWRFANDNASGSVNHFVNWSTFAKYEFDLPDIVTQKRISDIVWALNESRETYRNLLAKTDELVKSQFIEMFGDNKRVRLGDYIQQIRGVSYKPVDLNKELNSEYITLLRANNISGGTINFDEVQYVKRKKVSEKQVICNNDILMCASSGSLEHVGKAALCTFDGEHTFGAFCKLIRAVKEIRAEYIAAYFQGAEYRRIISDLAQGANINNLRNEHVDDLQIPYPEPDTQEKFIEFLKQSDKSKFEINQKIDNLTKMIESAVNSQLFEEEE